MDIIEGYPFERLLIADENRRIDASVEELLAADAAIKNIRLACGALGYRIRIDLEQLDT